MDGLEGEELGVGKQHFFSSLFGQKFDSVALDVEERWHVVPRHDSILMVTRVKAELENLEVLLESGFQITR